MPQNALGDGLRETTAEFALRFLGQVSESAARSARNHLKVRRPARDPCSEWLEQDLDAESYGVGVVIVGIVEEQLILNLKGDV